MKTRLSPSLASIVALAALALPPIGTAASTVLYSTSFEPPVCARGLLTGQDGWATGLGIDAVLVGTTQPNSGAQSVEFDGSLLGVGGNALTRRLFDYDAVANGTPVVRAEVAARLDGPGTDTDNGPADDLISLNLEGIGPSGAYFGALALSSSGEVWVFGSRPADAYATAAPAQVGRYYTLALEIDFAARATSFFLDGAFLTSLPFDASVTTNVVRTARLTTFPAASFDPAPYRGYFDDFAVSAFGSVAGTICHKPGTPAQHTLSLPEAAIPAHVNHGDLLGGCPQ